LVIQRGEIWWADLDDPAGSAPAYRRPVVVVQAESFNRSRIETIVAVALSSNLRLVAAPGNVLLERKVSMLAKDSVANVSQLVTLDRTYLTERVAKLPTRTMAAIDAGLRLVLDL
jgi:mRNA interferase MazF